MCGIAWWRATCSSAILRRTPTSLTSCHGGPRVQLPGHALAGRGEEASRSSCVMPRPRAGSRTDAGPIRFPRSQRTPRGERPVALAARRATAGMRAERLVARRRGGGDRERFPALAPVRRAGAVAGRCGVIDLATGAGRRDRPIGFRDGGCADISCVATRAPATNSRGRAPTDGSTSPPAAPDQIPRHSNGDGIVHGPALSVITAREVSSRTSPDLDVPLDELGLGDTLARHRGA
jgi:hypothetical protein